MGVRKPSLGIETQPTPTLPLPLPLPPGVLSGQRKAGQKCGPLRARGGTQPAGLPRHLRSAVQTICAGHLSSNFHNSPGIWEPSLCLRKLRQGQAKSLTQEITGANPGLRQPLVSRGGIQAQPPNQAEGRGEGSASRAPDLLEEQPSLHPEPLLVAVPEPARPHHPAASFTAPRGPSVSRRWFRTPVVSVCPVPSSTPRRAECTGEDGKRGAFGPGVPCPCGPCAGDGGASCPCGPVGPPSLSSPPPPGGMQGADPRGTLTGRVACSCG